MAKYFRIEEIDAATFERMTGDELDCLQVALLADDGNVYVAVDEDGQDYIEVDLEMFDAACRVIDNATTVDAVVVTRCKDCKYYRNHPNGLCYLHTEPKETERGYSGDAVCVEPDDFCSYGEPKEGTHADNYD